MEALYEPTFRSNVMAEARTPQERAANREHQLELWKRLHDRAPTILGQVEEEFRRVLGALSTPSTDHSD